MEPIDAGIRCIHFCTGRKNRVSGPPTRLLRKTESGFFVGLELNDVARTVGVACATNRALNLVERRSIVNKHIFGGIVERT